MQEIIENLPAGMNKVVEVINPDALGDVVLVCEHASNFIPADMHNLGMDEAVTKSHAAWDPGALAVAKLLSKSMDATLVATCFSRLIYDCNRPPESPTAMPFKSEIYDIPGNLNLSPEARQDRVDQFYTPFRNALHSVVDKRIAEGKATRIVTIHSFTPIYHGETRRVDVGLIHDETTALTLGLMKACEGQQEFVFKLNDPYGAKDGVTHTLQEHAEAKGLHNVMIEIKNSVIADADGQKKIADLLHNGLQQALEEV